MCCTEYFEKLNLDKFYRWKEKSLCGQFLPSQKLEMVHSFREARRRRSGNLDILFVSTSMYKFIYRQQPDNADDLLKHITEQQKFYLGLDKKIPRHFVLRPCNTFFNHGQYFVTDEVKSLFEELHAVGIYHTSVESAVSFLNEKYESIEKWWEMPETKSASDR